MTKGAKASRGRGGKPAAYPGFRRRLIALDVDGTIITHAGHLDDRVRDAIEGCVHDYQHVVIATGRSVVATMPVLARLGITQGYAVCSNGAVTLRIDPSRPKGYKILEKVTFDPRPALTLLREELPEALVAVEDLGRGFLVSSPFPDGELMGDQRVVPWDKLVGRRATRVTLRMPAGPPGWTSTPRGSPRGRRWSCCGAGWASSRATPSPLATSATTSRCSSGLLVGSPWATRLMRSRQSPTR